MARIDGLLFGYTVFSVDVENINVLASTLLSLGISARIKKNATCEVRLADARRLRRALIGKIDFTETEAMGLPGLLYKNRHRYGTLIGIIAAVIILIWTSGTVWDVRVDGLGADEDGETLILLEELGVYAGARWSEIDKDATEAKLLTLSDDVAWVNINRRGTVAYVSIKEKERFDAEEETPPRYSNITATCDGIIEEINVKSGYPLVKVGDTVKCGDILISGVIPGELGGGFCRAEGTVRARTFERISASACDKVSEKAYISEKYLNINYKILGFSINILKNSRNSTAMCDIIEYKSDFLLFDKYKLPLKKCVTAELTYKIEERARTADELLKCASEELLRLLEEGLSDSELLKIKTDGFYTENGYTMYADVSVLKNIGTETELSVISEKKG